MSLSGKFMNMKTPSYIYCLHNKLVKNKALRLFYFIIIFFLPLITDCIIKILFYFIYSLREKLIEINLFKLLLLHMVFLRLTKWIINYFNIKKLNNMKKQFQSPQNYHNTKAIINQLLELKSEFDKISESYSDIKKLQEDRDNIEKIMTDITYNDPEYTLYEGKEWNMKKLKEKAKSLNIPDFYFSSKKAYSYIIRTVEQLSKIENIIEPKYQDGYETEEMSDEDNDPYFNSTSE